MRATLKILIVGMVILFQLSSCFLDEPISYRVESGDDSGGVSRGAKQIALGSNNTCAIKTDDSVQCWGDNQDGQSSVPSGLGSVKSIAAGYQHTCAIKADDSVRCWGRDDDGQSSVPTEFQ